MKAKVNNSSKSAPVAVDSKANYRNALAKALGKKVTEVNPVEVPDKESTRTIVKSESFGRRNPFANTVKGEATETIEQVISKEVRKGRITPINEDEVLDEVLIDDEEEIQAEIKAHGGKKVIAQNSKQAQKLINSAVRYSPKELEAITVAKEIADAKAKLAASKAKGAAAPVHKSLKDMNAKEKAAYYKALSAKALAAKRAKAEVNDVPAPVAKEQPKLTRKSTFAASNPLASKIVPKGTATVKEAIKPAPIKSETKVTRIECVGMIISADSAADSDTIIKQADALYVDITKSESNIKETTFCYRYAVNFLKGYNIK